MKQQKFAPEELKNSKRIYKSVTPKYTLDWYIKWIASAFILAAMSIRGVDGLQFWDLGLSVIGISLWLWVSTRTESFRFKSKEKISILSLCIVFLIFKSVIWY